MSGANPQTLFRVRFNVRPTPAHPRYWDVQFGRFSLWLFDDSPEAAHARAEAILAQLPYEQIGERVRVFFADKETDPGFMDYKLAGMESARIAGMGFCLMAMETGADEDVLHIDDQPPSE